MEVFLPIIAGFSVGLLIGLTGMGGGALMTPFLLIFMKLDPVMAVGTDLVFAATTKIVGSIRHRMEENVDMKQVLWLACGSLPATFFSARYVIKHVTDTHFTEDILPVFLGSILLVVSVVIIYKSINRGDYPKPDEFHWPPSWAMVLIGAVGGVLVGMTSIGGGTVIMALLMIFFAVPVRYMVGLDVMHGALLAIVAAATYALAGQTQWSLVGLLLIGSLPGVWLGAKMINRIDRRLVRFILAVLVAVAGLYLIYR